MGAKIGNLSPMPAKEEVTKENAEIVDLFAGPGGLDIAAHAMGRRVVGIEFDADACATRRKAKLATIEDDVRKYGPAEFPNARILVGGPPCQTYSVAGNGVGRKALDQVLEFAERIAKNEDVTDEFALLDERTGLVLEPLRWMLNAIELDQPYDVLVLEQVPAVLPVWEAVRDVLKSRGYDAVAGVLHAEEFGVPQTRRRAILIANRGENVVSQLPAPRHRPYRKGRDVNEGDPKLKPWVSMATHLKRRDEFIVISNYGTGGDPKTRGQRHSSEPAATVTSKIFRNKIWSQDGSNTISRFSRSEAGMLQTFPKNYPWSGRDVAKQIGNAIPPLLARRVLEAALSPGRRDTLSIPHQEARASTERQSEARDLEAESSKS